MSRLPNQLMLAATLAAGLVALSACSGSAAGLPNPSASAAAARASALPLLPWAADRPLTWADFGGPVPDDKRDVSIEQRFAASIGLPMATSSHEAAETVTSIDGISADYSFSCLTNNGETGCHVTATHLTRASAFFDPNSSWAINSDENTALLAHEQGHFDIGEVYARRLDQAVSADLSSRLQAIVPTGPDQATAEADIKAQADTLVQQLTAGTMHDFAAAEQQYDDETKHGTDAAGQRQWSDRIRGELQAGGVQPGH